MLDHWGTLLRVSTPCQPQPGASWTAWSSTTVPCPRGQPRTLLSHLPASSQPEAPVQGVNPPSVPQMKVAGLRSHKALISEVGFSELPQRMIQPKGLSQFPRT